MCELCCFLLHSKISVLLGSGCKLLIKVWLPITWPRKKSARPESVHTPFLHPSVCSIFQYLVPYCVPCDTVVK